MLAAPVGLLVGTVSGYAGGWLDAVLVAIATGMAMLPEEIPVVLTVFLAAGAWRISKAQVLTRRAAAIETLGSTTVLCTDKTGTLTEGRPRVVHIEPAPGFLPDDLLVKLASVERASEHPLAMAVVAAAQERHLPLVEVTDFDSPVGKGVLGKVGNVALVSGAAKFLAEQMDVKLRSMARDGVTGCDIGHDLGPSGGGQLTGRMPVGQG